MNSRRDLGIGLPLTVTGLEEAGAFCAAACAQTGVEAHKDSATSRRTEFENMAVSFFESGIIAHPGRRPAWGARGFRPASAARTPHRPCAAAGLCPLRGKGAALGGGRNGFR